VKQLHAQGLTKGALGKAAKGLGKSLAGPTGPSWGLAGAGGLEIKTEAEPPSKYHKGKGKGKGKKDKNKGNDDGPKIDNGVLSQMMEKLRVGQAVEGLQLIHKRYGFACPQIMSVQQFANCAAHVGIRSKEEDVMRFFDGIQTLDLIRYPDMSASSYFQRFARWAVREFLAEGTANVERTLEYIPQLLERQGQAIQKLTASEGRKGGAELLLSADGLLPKGGNWVRTDWIMLTFPHTARVRMPPPGVVTEFEKDGSICVEAEILGFSPGGFAPQSGMACKVAGCKDELIKKMYGMTCRVDRIANRVTFSRQIEALHRICGINHGTPDDLGWLGQMLMAGEELYAGGTPASDIACVRPQGATFPEGHADLVTQVNASQLEALTAATSRRTTLIQGPPGAGKTHTSCTLIKLWCAAGRGPVIATADSNVAVDNLLMGCIKLGLEVTRVGRAEAIHSSLNDHSLYEKIRQDGNDVSGIRGNYAEERKILQASDVIACTTTGSAHPVFEGMRFNGVLVDEAGQATELSTLVPLMHLTPNGSCALVGDHKQLPATVACLEADIEGLGNSLFERLAAQGTTPILLNIQYRMHPAIAHYPSQEYYSGLLRSGVRGSKRKPPQGIQWPVPQAPVTFLPVEGREQRDGTSYTNQAEVNAVQELLRAVLAGGEIKPSEIGIITPYAAQVRLFRQCLGIPSKAELMGPAAAAQAANCPDVASVDGFQGREKELIFMSTVRANERGNVGFTGDPRRLNVSFTRAKRGLVICGNFDTLSKDTIGWQPWLLWAQQRGLIAGCEATDPEAAADLTKLCNLSEEELVNPDHKDEPPQLLALNIVVKEGVGAGVNLVPEEKGMRVLGVLPDPGQPGVIAGDLIVQIAGANLGPDAETSVEIFGERIKDGVEVILERAAK
jgi:hypothetical protein